MMDISSLVTPGPQFFDLPWGTILAFLGAALAVIMAGIGSAKGVGKAGEVAAGITAEDPDAFGKLLPLQALPGTQGFYGFIIAFVVFIKLNLLGGLTAVSTEQGFLMLLGCLPIAFGGYFSAVYQGKTAAAAIAMVGRRSEASGKGITMTVLVETYAVLALLASFLMVFFLP